MSVDSLNEAGSSVLRNYGSFLKAQDKSFIDIQKRMNTILLGNPDNKHLYPVNINIVPYENMPLLDVIESDNKILNKIIAAFSFLCQEIVFLQKEAKEKFYYFLLFYGDNFIDLNITAEEYVSKHIETFHQLTAFVKRCHNVIMNLCNQLCALFTSGYISTKCLKINYIFSNLGDILMVLVILDHLVNSSSIQNHWTAYRKFVKLLHQNPSKYNQSSESLKSIEIILNNIEEKLLSDKIFQHSMDALGGIKNKITEKHGIQLSQELTLYIKNIISDLEKSSVDVYESTFATQWVKINALFVFHFHVFGNTDKKVFKSLVDINVKAHSVPISGLLIWYPEQFILRYAYALCSNNNKISQNIARARQTYISNKKQSLSRDAYNAQMQSVKWALELNQEFCSGDFQVGLPGINRRMDLINNGVKFASQVNFLIRCFTSLHVNQSLAITKNALMSICKLVEILKGIESMFQHNYFSIATSIHLIIQHLSYQVISKLVSAKKTLIVDKNYSKQRLDELTAIVIAERALRGPATHQRRMVANIALSLVPLQIFSEDGFLKIVSLLESIESLIDIQQKINELCDCSFLYWNKSVLPVYLHNVLNSKKDFPRLATFFRALNDSSVALDKYETCVLGKENKSVKFYTEVYEIFNNILVKPLGQQIETNLRLHTHSHLKLDSMNPFIAPVEDVNSLLKIPIVKFHNKYFSISNAIEHYLSHTFYNLTTVVLHDWKTYGEMRQLANFKFDLNTIEDNLPAQTLEQGLDVLEIMRNINVFVSKYTYNLNNQIFVEQNSNTKYLNTINITHIANSIRTHGTGVMNTTVNFTYQFLRKKFLTFSQFMYDEQIKSRLIKDMRHFKESGTDTDQMYSYKRAEKFNKSIRNLGLNEDGQSYLDLFRILITHIGNAMGYVRMIRSGGLHCCANASAFLPFLEEELSFEELLGDYPINDTMKEATQHLDQTINNLTSNFSHGTEYFKLLVDVFAPVFRNPDNMHMKTFFMIVPPLTLNFIENILLCKDKMNKKNTTGAAFTDDGFAMGLAYILRLLDQDRGMDSLHWFQSVNKHIAQERKNVEDQLSKGTTQIHQALALTQKKLNILEQEFQLLYFSFSSARIFFQ